MDDPEEVLNQNGKGVIPMYSEEPVMLGTRTQTRK